MLRYRLLVVESGVGWRRLSSARVGGSTVPSRCRWSSALGRERRKSSESDGSNKRYFPVEVGLSFGMEFQSHTASCSDTLQHRERMPGVFGILEASDHRLGRADPFGKLGLSQRRFFPHFAHKQREVNLAKSTRKCRAIACAPAGSLGNDFAVPVALHSPSSFRIASRSLCDPA